MIKIKSEREIEMMREAGRITALALSEAKKAVRPGVTTGEIDRVVRKTIEDAGAKPSFLGYRGFPGSACISLNSEVIHGIPSAKKRVENGDIIKIDVGAFYKGYHGDSAATFAAGEISPEVKRLIDVTRQSFYEGIRYARVGQRVSDVSHAVQAYVEEHGFSVVRDFLGHGVGMSLHEDPEVPNFGRPGRGPRFLPGMVIAVEPMVNQGSFGVRILDNGWTVVTADSKLSAHYENTILITEGDPEILTAREDM